MLAAMKATILLLASSFSCLACALTDEQILRIKSDDVVLALKEKNFGVLAGHMKSGGKLRFSPYVHLDASDRRLTASQVTSFFSTAGLKNWGTQDGSGNPILLTTTQYYNRYLFRGDYTAATSVTYNARMASGNLMSNFATIYPGRAFYEYYIPASTQGGMDWKALDVIWQKDAAGIWRLVALVNDEWTI